MLQVGNTLKYQRILVLVALMQTYCMASVGISQTNPLGYDLSNVPLDTETWQWEIPIANWN